MFSDKGTNRGLQEGHFSSPSGERLCTDNKTNGFSVVKPEWNIMLLPLSTSSVMMTHFVNEDESIQYIHDTTIGLFLSCFITQKKSITNQPSSSRNDQHLISPYILHHLIRTKRLQEWNVGNGHYSEKWHTFFKKNSIISTVECNNMTTALTQSPPY